MKCIFWNIRGIGNLETQIHLFHLIQTYKPDFLFLAEPLINFTDIPPWYWKKLHLHNNILNHHNNIPTLWCLWNNHQHITILLNTAQCLAFTFLDEGTPTYMAAIYASTLYMNRRKLWLDLTKLLTDHPGA